MKFGKTRQCPKCQETLRNKAGVMTDHFKKRHSEYKFHREQGHMVCDTCNMDVNGFSRLVKKHSHPGGPLLIKEMPVSEYNSVADPLKALSDFATSLHNLVNEVLDLKAEVLFRERERDHYKQCWELSVETLNKRTAQVVAAQNALADLK